MLQYFMAGRRHEILECPLLHDLAMLVDRGNRRDDGKHYGHHRYDGKQSSISQGGGAGLATIFLELVSNQPEKCPQRFCPGTKWNQRRRVAVFAVILGHDTGSCTEKATK